MVHSVIMRSPLSERNAGCTLQGWGSPTGAHAHDEAVCHKRRRGGPVPAVDQEDPASEAEQHLSLLTSHLNGHAIPPTCCLTTEPSAAQGTAPVHPPTRPVPLLHIDDSSRASWADDRAAPSSQSSLVVAAGALCIAGVDQSSNSSMPATGVAAAQQQQQHQQGIDDPAVVRSNTDPRHASPPGEPNASELLRAALATRITTSIINPSISANVHANSSSNPSASLNAHMPHETGQHSHSHSKSTGARPGPGSTHSAPACAPPLQPPRSNNTTPTGTSQPSGRPPKRPRSAPIGGRPAGSVGGAHQGSGTAVQTGSIRAFLLPAPKSSAKLSTQQQPVSGPPNCQALEQRQGAQDQEADAQVEEELEEAQGPCKVSRQGSGRLSGGNHGSYMSQPPPAARQPGGGMTEQGTLEQQHQEIQEGVPDMQDGQEGPHMQQGDDCTPPGSQQVPSSTDQELGGTQQGPGSTPGSQQAGSQQCNNEQLSSQGSGGESGAVAGLRAKLVKERRLRHQAEQRLEEALLQIARLQQELACRNTSDRDEQPGTGLQQVASLVDAPIITGTCVPTSPEQQQYPSLLPGMTGAEDMHVDAAPDIAGDAAAAPSGIAAQGAGPPAGAEGARGQVEPDMAADIASAKPITTPPPPTLGSAPADMTHQVCTPALGSANARAQSADKVPEPLEQVPEPSSAAADAPDLSPHNNDDSAAAGGVDMPPHNTEEVEVAAAALLGPLALHRCWGVATPCNSGAGTPSSSSPSPAGHHFSSSEQGTPVKPGDAGCMGAAGDRNPTEEGMDVEASPGNAKCESSVTDSPASVIPLIACGSPVTGLFRGSGPSAPCLGRQPSNSAGEGSPGSREDDRVVQGSLSPAGVAPTSPAAAPAGNVSRDVAEGPAAAQAPGLLVKECAAGTTLIEQQQQQQQASAGSPGAAANMEVEGDAGASSAPTARALFRKASGTASSSQRHSQQQHTSLGTQSAPAGKASSPTAAILIRMMGAPSQPSAPGSSPSPSPSPAAPNPPSNPLKSRSRSPAPHLGSKSQHVSSRRASLGQSPHAPTNQQQQQQQQQRTAGHTPPKEEEEECNITLCPIQQQRSSVPFWRAHQSGRRSGSPLVEDPQLLLSQQQQQQQQSSGQGQQRTPLPPPPLGSGFTASPSTLSALQQPLTVSTPIVTLVGLDKQGTTTPGSSCQHPSPPASGARNSAPASPHSKAGSPHNSGQTGAPGARSNSGTPSAGHHGHSSQPSSQQKQHQPLSLTKPGVLAAIERAGTRGLTARQLGQQLSILAGWPHSSGALRLQAILQGLVEEMDVYRTPAPGAPQSVMAAGLVDIASDGVCFVAL